MYNFSHKHKSKNKNKILRIIHKCKVNKFQILFFKYCSSKKKTPYKIDNIVFVLYFGFLYIFLVIKKRQYYKIS